MLLGVTLSKCVAEGLGLVEGGGDGEGCSFMGVSLADASQIIGFGQREGKCV